MCESKIGKFVFNYCWLLIFRINRNLWSQNICSVIFFSFNMLLTLSNIVENGLWYVSICLSVWYKLFKFTEACSFFKIRSEPFIFRLQGHKEFCYITVYGEIFHCLYYFKHKEIYMHLWATMFKSIRENFQCISGNSNSMRFWVIISGTLYFLALILANVQ